MATLGQKIRLLGGLLAGGIARTDPFYVTVDTTRRCNLTCLGCRYHSTEVSRPSPGDQSVRDIPFELFERLCDELETMATSSMCLIGEGEPLLHPRIFDIISRAKAAGLTVDMCTNGTLLDEANCERLIDSGLDVLKVSLWATSPDEYARNYRGTDPAWFGKVVDGLKRLSQAKAARGGKRPHVILHQPVNRHNFRSVDAAAELAHETGCDSLSFSPFKTRRGELAGDALSPEEETELRRSLAGLRTRLKRTGLGHNIAAVLLRYEIGDAVWEKVPCYVAWLHARVKVDGTVIPCNPCDRPLGNIGGSTLREIWNGPGFRSFRTRAITRDGLAGMGDDCDCGFCCHLVDNIRVHRFFKWVPSFRKEPCSET